MQAHFPEKNQIRAYNLQCYMFIHPPGADSLCSLPSLFPTSRPLCGRSPAESEEKYLSDKPVSSQTYLFIICQPFLSFNISLLLPVQPTGKRLGGCLRCYLWEGFWSFELMAHNGLQILKDTILLMSQNCYNNVYAVKKFVKILTFVNNMNSS